MSIDQQRYQILRLLGQGRLSQTYLTLDRTQMPPRRCVIKQIQIGGLFDELGLARWIAKLRTLQHSQLPTGLELVESTDPAGFLYWVQEYIGGESLATRLKQRTLTSIELWQVLESILPVLSDLHHQQFLHGDIKPANLIDRNQPQTDWVLVDLAGLPPTAFRGDPEFAAPEQLRGEANLSSDLYSLGLTAVHLLTGVSPIELSQTSWRQYWQPEKTDSHPEQLAQFLDRLLIPEPGQRLTTAEALTALERIRGKKRQSSPVQIQISEASGFSKERSGQAIGSCVAILSGHQNTSTLLRAINAVAASNQLIASAQDDKCIQLWQLPTGKALAELQGHTGAVKTVAFHPQNSNLLVSGSHDRTIKIWNVQTQQMVQTLTGHTGAVNSVAFSPDGQILASGSSDKTLKLWELQTGSCLATLSGHRLAVNSIQFSPTGEYLASASADATVHLWNWASGKSKVLQGHLQAVRAIAFSSNGLLASAGEDRTIRIWDRSTGSCQILSGHPWSVTALLFSTDDRFLISGSWDKTIKFWRVETGQEVAVLTGHTDSVNSLALLPNGQLASASRDATVRLWVWPQLAD